MSSILNSPGIPHYYDKELGVLVIDVTRILDSDGNPATLQLIGFSNFASVISTEGLIVQRDNGDGSFTQVGWLRDDGVFAFGEGALLISPNEPGYDYAFLNSSGQKVFAIANDGTLHGKTGQGPLVFDL